jgi:hypothetical protein
MKPRLPSSKKWTAFPKEYLEQIDTVFKQGFAAQLVGAQLFIEGRIYPQEILLRVGMLEKGRLVQNNFEVSVEYSPIKKDAVERIHNAIDAAASMMNEYFETDGEVEFPKVWKEYDFDPIKVFLQYSTVNTGLEAQANALLEKTDPQLVIEEDESEDALDRAEESLATEADDPDDDLTEEGASEDQDEDDDEERKSPSMFSGKKKKESLH